MSSSPPPYDRARLREMMLYISQRCANDPAFGATKLNKILFYSDFAAYAKFGKPITGAVYQKLPKGPAPRQLKPVCRQLIADHEAAVDRRQYFGFEQQRLIPLREPDLTLFTAVELDLANRVIDALWGQTATEVSDLSHLELGWRLVGDGEDIPYWTVFIDEDQTPTADDVHWVQTVAAEHGYLTPQ